MEGASRTLSFPSPQLWPYVDRYWSWTGGGTLLPFYPGTGCEFILAVHGRLWLRGEESPLAVSLPPCFFLAPRTRRVVLGTEGLVHVVAVRFRSGGLRHFMGPTMNQVVDTLMAPEDLWGRDWHESGLPEVLVKMMSPPGQGDMRNLVVLLDHFLQRCLHRYQHPDLWLDRWVQKLYYAPPGTRVRTVVEEAPLGLRQMERKCLEATGLGPKALTRYARFGRVVRAICLEGRRDLAALAQDNGFCDQAHLTTAFRTLSGLSPGRFLQGLDGMSFFYNTSRPR